MYPLSKNLFPLKNLCSYSLTVLYEVAYFEKRDL